MTLFVDTELFVVSRFFDFGGGGNRDFFDLHVTKCRGQKARTG